jgi:hypothetical protein
MVETWQLSKINGRIVASLKKEAATAQMNTVKAMTAAADLQTRLAEAESVQRRSKRRLLMPLRRRKKQKPAHLALRDK